MKITYQHRDATLWVQLEGELDHHWAASFRETVDGVLREHPEIRQLRINATGLRFMDSSGIGALLGRCREIKARRGTVALYGLQPPVRRLAEMAGLSQVMDVE